ncbi:immunity 22 family protein [Bacillus pseudomycoides]|uniref:immunity 22 family protein n=1 Tax=Bacillus pseudomycoides TaxID=64104 RepID=UPI001FB52B9B|nr:immunity 22 family protein [Bacillus pseudomycoides]
MNEKVSVWIGNFESKAELMDYINIEYTEDGDSLSSIFEKNFHLDYYDRDLVEKKWISQPTNNIRDLLKGFSYSDQFIKRFDVINHEKEFNTTILVYNLEYDAQETKIKYNNNEMEFIGVAQYTIVIDDRW